MTPTLPPRCDETLEVEGTLADGLYDASPWIARERLPGPRLDERIPPGGLPWRQAVSIASAVGEALAALHAAGFLHRDVNSANVLLDARGRWRLTGFDVACVRDTAEVSEERGEGLLVGTPGYLAPELVLGRPATVRTEVYALGALLHELLTGRLPFVGSDGLERMARCLEGAPSGPRALRSDVPARLDALVRRTLSREPEQRPNTLDALLRSMRAQLLAESQSVPPARPEYVASAPIAAPLLAPRQGGFRAHAVAALVCLAMAGTYLALSGSTAIGGGPERVSSARVIGSATARAAAMAAGSGFLDSVLRQTLSGR